MSFKINGGDVTDDGRITANTTNIGVNTTADAALEARVLALESPTRQGTIYAFASINPSGTVASSWMSTMRRAAALMSRSTPGAVSCSLG